MRSWRGGRLGSVVVETFEDGDDGERERSGRGRITGSYVKIFRRL